MKILWIHRSMRETTSVVETGTRKDLRATIFLEVPGLLSAKQQIPTQQIALTLEILEEKYPQADWTHIHTGGSVKDAVKNGGSSVFVRTQKDKQLATQILQAENAQISKQKPQHSRMQ